MHAASFLLPFFECANDFAFGMKKRDRSPFAKQNENEGLPKVSEKRNIRQTFSLFFDIVTPPVKPRGKALQNCKHCDELFAKSLPMYARLEVIHYHEAVYMVVLK